MTVPEWPVSLPRPERNGYKAQNMDPRLRKSTETGPPGYRRAYSKVARSVSLTIDVSRADKAVFDTFHELTTGAGTTPFWMPDPTTDGWQMLTETGAPILTGEGLPVLLSARWLCLFGETAPTEIIRGVRFIISFPVWVMP